jgi:hypothetical protein
MNENIYIGLIVVFITLSMSLSLFGKKVPNKIWILSLGSGAIVGLLLGLRNPFPANIYISLCLIPIFMGLPVILWLPIRLHRK